LLEAFKQVHRASKQATALDIYGAECAFRGSEEHLSDYKKMARGLPVTFHGPIEHHEISKALASMNTLVIPSLWWETHGRVVREAWMANIPVIASGVGALGEAIEHEKTGLLVWPGDAVGLGEEMLRLINDTGLRQTLVQNSPTPKSITQDIEEHMALYSEFVNN